MHVRHHFFDISWVISFFTKFSLQAYWFYYITFEIHIWENIKPYSSPLTHIMIFFFEEWGSVLHNFLRRVLEMFIFHFIADTVFCFSYFSFIHVLLYSPFTWIPIFACILICEVLCLWWKIHHKNFYPRVRFWFSWSKILSILQK